MSRRRTKGRWRSMSAVGIVTVAVLLSVCFTLEQRAQSSPISVVLVSTTPGAQGFSAQFRLTPTDGAIEAHTALVPGVTGPVVSAVFVFYDPGYFLRFGTVTDLVGLEDRIADYLSHTSPSIPVSLVDAAALPATLGANPHAALVDFGYSTLPDTIFSENSTQLETWLEGGGTLIWAGGPLAYFEGHTTSTGGFVYDNLGWAGQVKLVGYSLEDPIGNPATTSYGPLVGTVESPIGTSLGITYDGTPDGANLTQLEAHNGTSLGFETPNSGDTSGRTSLAYVPIGKGGVYYFGGAIWGDSIGLVPDADAALSADIGLLLGTGYVPLEGPTTYTNTFLGYLRSSTVTLSVTGQYSHLVALVTCDVGPTSLFVWSREVV